MLPHGPIYEVIEYNHCRVQVQPLSEILGSRPRRLLHKKSTIHPCMHLSVHTFLPICFLQVHVCRTLLAHRAYMDVFRLVSQLANIYSTEFVVETADERAGKHYRQVFRNNMQDKVSRRSARRHDNGSASVDSIRPY